MIVLQNVIAQGAADLIINNIFKNDLLQVAVSTMCQQTSIIGIGLAIFFFVLMLGYNYVKNSIEAVTSDNKDGEIVSIKEITRCIVILLMIIAYPLVIMPTLNGFVYTVNSLTRPSLKQQAVYYEKINKYYEQVKLSEEQAQQKKKDALQKIVNSKDPKITAEQKQVAQALLDDMDDSSVGSQVLGLFKAFTSAIQASVSALGTALLSTIAGLIKIIIAIMSVLIFKILLVLGPLALAVSIIPAFKGQADVWFGTTITAGLVLTTIHILDHLYFVIMAATFSAGVNGEFSATDINMMTALSFTMIIMYSMTFWLTSKWIGKGDGGRVITKAITLAAIAASMGAGAAAGAAKGGGGAFKGAMNALKQSQSQGNNNMFSDQE